MEKNTPVRDWQSVEQTQITDFLIFRKRSGLQASSVRLDAVAIRIFFRFLTARRAWPSNPAATLVLPRPEKHLPETLRPEQVQKLLESIGRNDPLGRRDRAMMELLYSSGLRVSELLTLPADALRGDPEMILVKGKGGKERLVPTLPVAAQAIARYATLCPFDLTPDAPLFRGARGGPLNPRLVQKVMEQARLQMGLPATATPHTPRAPYGSRTW